MKDAKLIELFRRLTRTAIWEQQAGVALPFDNHHPQGLVRIGDLFYLSSVELIERPVTLGQPSEGHDRTPGLGVGHVFIFDNSGRLKGDIVLGEGAMYHPGGIDYDGRHIWVSVAEYRPHSRSIIYKLNPVTRKVEEVFRVADHIGGIVVNARQGELTGYSWGSRKFYQWSTEGQLLREKDNPSHFIDYQDGQYAGDGCMITGGIAELPDPAGGGSKRFQLGGLALIDMHTLETLHEVPVLAHSPQGHVITRNPVWVESAGQAIRLYAVPDDHRAELLIFEASLR